jgi:putative addiction module killer protein
LPELKCLPKGNSYVTIKDAFVLHIVEYIRQDGRSPFEDWFTCLETQAAARVATAILRLEAGNLSNIKWFSGIGELKINWGPGYRVYLLKDGELLIVLLGGGSKRNQQRDIERSMIVAAEYKSRKRGVGFRIVRPH